MPKRVPVLFAKLVVFVMVVGPSMIATSSVAFLTAEAWISRYRPGHSLGDPGVLRVVVGTGMFLTLVGVLGSALGWIIRSTPGALVALFVALVALPDVFSYFGGWGKTVAKYSPLSAGQSFITSIHASDALAPWLGFLVLVLWVVAALTIAVILLLHRDA